MTQNDCSMSKVHMMVKVCQTRGNNSVRPSKVKLIRHHDNDLHPDWRSVLLTECWHDKRFS